MNKEEISTIQQIKKEKAVLLYFSSEQCGVCNVLKPKLKAEIEQEFPLLKFIEISAQNDMETAIHFHVHSAPTIIVLFEGNEFYRENGNISISAFLQKIERPYTLLFE